MADVEVKPRHMILRGERSKVWGCNRHVLPVAVGVVELCLARHEDLRDLHRLWFAKFSWWPIQPQGVHIFDECKPPLVDLNLSEAWVAIAKIFKVLHARVGVHDPEVVAQAMHRHTSQVVPTDTKSLPR